MTVYFKKTLPWSVIITIVLGVVIPSACIIWMMQVAISNERLAMRQKMDEVYTSRLATIQSEWNNKIHQVLNTMEAYEATYTPPEIFYRIVTEAMAESAIVIPKNIDHKHKKNILASTVSISNPNGYKKQWQDAKVLEFRKNAFIQAKTLYKLISEKSTDIAEVARALMAESRCLIKLKRYPEAIYILNNKLRHDRFNETVSENGRSIFLQSRISTLSAIENMNGIDQKAHRNIKDSVKEALVLFINNYETNDVSSEERLYIYKALKLTPKDAPLIQAELIASRMADVPALTERRSRLTLASQGWAAIKTKSGMSTLFYSKTFIDHQIENIINRIGMQGILISVSHGMYTDVSDDSERHKIDSLSLDAHFQGWKLDLYTNDPDLTALYSHRNMASYLVLGVLFICIIGIFIFLLARQLYKQYTLANLKNDLISTISHDLKTPLSSSLLLTESLLKSDEKFSMNTERYLQMICKEHLHLNHLIDNFLAFSRMENNKYVFKPSTLTIKGVIESTVERMSEKLELAKFTVDVTIDNDIPDFVGDFHALVNALTNLIDNAYKYTKEDKYIAIRATAIGHIRIAVEDRGIGIPKKEQQKIFDRFYRVDQRLSRDTEGSGLGLNITDQIVKHHGGRIIVESQPGKGSIFTICLQYNQNL